jgi:Fe-S cluster assembly protein SufD
VEQGYPTSRDEGWKYTNVSALARTPFGPAPSLAMDDFPQVSAAAGYALGDDGAARLVFLNGRLQPDLSSVERLPAGVSLVSLARALEEDGGALEAWLADPQRPAGHVFAALNDAFFTDGVVLRIPEGKVVAAPIHLVHLAQAGDAPVLIHPRILIHAGRGSQAMVTEIHASAGATPCFTNAVTQIFLADGAVVSHTKVVEEADTASHVGFLAVRQGRDSNFSSVALALGGGLVRLDPHVRLEDQGAECVLDGLYMTHGQQQVDNHTMVDHLAPRTGSRQLYKGILDGASRGVFFGRVLVRPDAQKISAVQSTQNLILSDAALANSTPQLEIHADDVQCRHGSTIGQLDETMLFYLRTRGISQEAARSVLTYAFASEILARVGNVGLRQALERHLFPEAAA